MRHPGDDDLALLALGEHQPAVQEHVRTCPACSAELRTLRATVRTVRDAELGVLPPAPPSVWDRIAGELGLAGEATGSGPAVTTPVPAPAPSPATSAGPAGSESPGAAGPASGPAARPAAPAGASASSAAPRRSPTRLAVAALALAACAAAVGILTRDAGPTVPASQLAALGSASGRGEAVLVTGSAGRVLEVDTEGLAPPAGFYEVWLLDPGTDRILALGTLDETGHARLSVPDGVDLADYAVVDVSAEPDDGNPAHSSDSVLRGGLPA